MKSIYIDFNYNLKNIFSFSFGLFAAVFLLFSSAKAQNIADEINLTAQEKQWVKDNPQLISIVAENFSPTNFIKDGKATGFSIDYLDLVAKKVGIQIEYVNKGSWEDNLAFIRNGNADIAHSLSLTEERSEYFNYTDTYLEVPMVYFGRLNAGPINNIDDLSDKKIGIHKNTIASNALKRNFPQLNYVEFTDVEDALTKLSIGSIDIVISTLPHINYAISKNFISGLKVLGNDFLLEKIDYLHLAVLKDRPILYQLLQKGMLAITDKEFMDISNKWLVETQTGNNIGLTLDELDWLSKNKTIKVAASSNEYPYEFIDENGEISGLSGSYLDEISKTLNVKFIWSGNQNLAEGFADLNSGDADMFLGLTATSERKKILTFTQSYKSLVYVIFARDGGPKFTEVVNLEGFKIAQSKGSAIVEYLKNDYPGIDIIEVKNSIEALKLVSSGDADAYIGDIPSTVNNISSNGLTNISVVGDAKYKMNDAMGIRMDLPLLASSIEKALNNISEDKKAELSTQWLTVRLENIKDYTLIWQIVAIAVLIISFILFWLNKSQLEVQRRKIIEEELRIAKNEAKTAQVEAEKANDAKSSFLANMSHEIRTPLNAIMGFSEVMSRGIFGEIKQDKYKEYLKDIRGSGEHLSLVIKNILDLSKIEAGKWELEEEIFDLEDCINDAIKMLEVAADEKNINLIHEQNMPLYIVGECHAIKRSIINLLSNAVKFTYDNGPITCRVSDDENANVIIEIIDTGIGIPQDKLQDVLQPFGQNHEVQASNESGTGLGLAIVKQLIELHDGTFRLESEIGIGTKATILIPRARVIVDSKAKIVRFPN